MKQLKNKKAEIGETMTWFVATLVVIVFLVITIFVVSLISKERNFTFSSYRDSVVAKSLSAFMLTKDGEKMIFERLPEDKDFTEFSGKLSVKVLKELYGETYGNIGLTTSFPFPGTEAPVSVMKKYWGSDSAFTCYASQKQERIYFPGNKHLILCLKE